MPSPSIGSFKIRNVDSVQYDVWKNNLICQTYIINFKGRPRIPVNLPWHVRLAKTIDIFLDNNFDYSVYEKRIKSEGKPSYVFINGVKFSNNGILDITWAELLS